MVRGGRHKVNLKGPYQSGQFFLWGKHHVMGSSNGGVGKGRQDGMVTENADLK